MFTRSTQHTDNLTTQQLVHLGDTNPGITEGPVSSLDDSTPQVTSKVGVHLAEQQQTIVRQAVDGNQRDSISRSQAHLNEEDWTLQKMLERENLVGAFQWSLTDAVGSELAIVGTNPSDVPADLLQNDLVSTPFDRFQWWRCDKIRVRFQLVASRFHQGRLGVYFVPSMMPKQYITNGVYKPTRWTQLQHAFLDPANGTVIDMEIPFRYHKGWIDLVFGDSLGQLHVQVLNGLQAASGASTSVEVKVFVSFIEPKFRVPRPGGTAFKQTLQKTAERLGYTLVKKEEPADKAVSWGIFNRAKRESGLFTQLGTKAGKEIDELASSILPSEVTGAIAKIALDKPAVTEFPTPLAHKDAQYMSASRGIENLERMTLEPSAQYITDDQFGDTVDETDMKFLLKKPVYLTTFNWSATNPVGYILWQNIVSPMHLATAENAQPNVPFDVTILGFLANLFTYWRGSINLIFQVVGTAFHEGRLDFCNHPATISPPSDYVTSMSQYVNSQTIRNTNNTVEVRIPFHSDTPWKRVWFIEPLSDTVTDNAVRAMDYVTGSVSVRVAVPLKNPNNVVNNVDVNVFVCAGDDFEFHTLSPWGGIVDVADLNARQRERERIEKPLKASRECGRCEEQAEAERNERKKELTSTILGYIERIRVSLDEAAAYPIEQQDEDMLNLCLTNLTGSYSMIERLNHLLTGDEAPLERANDAMTMFATYAVATLKAPRAVRESGDLNIDDKTDNGKIHLGMTPAYTYDPAVHHFGETYSNLREMAKRYQFSYGGSVPITAKDNYFNLAFDGNSLGGLFKVLYNSYRLFRGPLNGKVQLVNEAFSSGNIYPQRITGYLTTNPQPALFATAPLTTPYMSLDGAVRSKNLNMPPLVRFSTEQVAEFQLPFQSIYHSLCNYMQGETSPDYFGNQYTQFSLLGNIQYPNWNAANQRASVTLAIALGDETRFGVFLGFPQVVIAANHYPNPPIPTEGMFSKQKPNQA